MEATMRVLSIKELMRLTRIELTDLYVRITNALPDMPDPMFAVITALQR
jgi:hypothetical protein